jgi:aspartate ammonia-lyase
MKTRTEHDQLGPAAVPLQALYGAQTQRAVENFPLGRQRSLGSYPSMVQALLQIKLAAATANGELGLLPPEIAQALQDAARTMLRDLPEAGQHFPIHARHGGGGTSANMNANEVLANLAEERLGGRRGEYRIVHPNDHANLKQSTNDVYPTACHMAILSEWPGLERKLDALAAGLRQAADRMGSLPHLARTCLQDAVDIRFGDYLGGLASQVERQTARLAAAADRLHRVNLGGTICGRSEDVPAGYMDRIIPALREASGDDEFVRAADLFDAAQNPDDLAAVSAGLDLLARGLIKMAKDMRLLGSGPQAGLGELHLPAVQPGSSIMPGKVNPVIPEFLIQACFGVMGNHAACAAGLEHGELDLNVWESSMTFSVLDSFEVLTEAVSVFHTRCIAGLEADVSVNLAHSRSLIPRLTRLAQRHGYQRVAAVCKEAGGDLMKLKASLDETFGAEPEGDRS